MNPSDQARQVGIVDSWLNQIEVTNSIADPAAGTVLADTGPLTGGYYDVYYVLAYSAALIFWNFAFQHRNAANAANLWYDYFVAAEAGSARYTLKNIKVAANERFRFLCSTDYIGTITTGIIAVRRA